MTDTRRHPNVINRDEIEPSEAIYVVSGRGSVRLAKKVGVAAGTGSSPPWIRQIVRQGESLGYYDDEPDAG